MLIFHFRFPNDGCTSDLDTYGVCYSASECASRGGTSSGDQNLILWISSPSWLAWLPNAQPFQWARPPVCMYMMFSGSGFGFFCFLFSVLWFLLLSGTCASGFGVCCTFQVNSFVDKRQKCERKRTKSVSCQSQSFSGVLWRIDLSEQHLLCKVWTLQLTSSGVVSNSLYDLKVTVYDNARISPMLTHSNDEDSSPCTFSVCKADDDICLVRNSLVFLPLNIAEW